MNFLTMLLIVSIINNVLSLKSSDLCATNKKDCKKNLNVNCEHLKCSGNHSYQCSPEHCALNEATCKAFFNIGYKLKSLRSLRSKMPIEKFYKEKMNEYVRLTTNIQKCLIRKRVSADTRTDDVCLSGLNCRLKQELPLRYGEITILTTIECPCDGIFNYKCGKHYCTKNRTKCDDLLKDSNSNYNHIGECGNDNKEIHEKKTFYKHQRLDFLF